MRIMDRHLANAMTDWEFKDKGEKTIRYRHAVG
jgi:hypothetical protein